ncbi:MAG: glycosyltransferase family 87 protein [Terracidiphilus sp.]
MSKRGIYLHGGKWWLQGIAIVLTLVVMGHVMIVTSHDLEKYPGIDLRDKVVGARLLLRGMNPYYDFRNEPHPDHLRMLTTNTYSPALLLLYAPFCELDWSVQRFIYFLFDWVAILLCYAILAHIFPGRASGTALWLGFVLLFIADFGFRFELERGQYYVGITLLTAAASACLLRRPDSWLGALPLALLVLLRPTYAICIIGAFLLRRTRHAAHAVVLCGLMFAATLPIVGIADWRGYVASIHTNEKEVLDDAYAQGPKPAAAEQSEMLEGVDFSKSMAGPGYLTDRTLIGLARSSVSPALARLIHQVAPSKQSLQRLNAACLLLALCFNVAVMYLFARGTISSLMPVAFVFLAPLNLELFAPQRYGYCDVTILAPLLLIVAAGLGKGKPSGRVLYVVILAFGFVIPWLAFHFDKHVPLVSFSKYVVMLAILNVVCIREAWKLQRFSRTRAAVPEHRIGERGVGFAQP